MAQNSSNSNNNNTNSNNPDTAAEAPQKAQEMLVEQQPQPAQAASTVIMTGEITAVENNSNNNNVASVVPSTTSQIMPTQSDLPAANKETTTTSSAAAAAASTVPVAPAQSVSQQPPVSTAVIQPPPVAAATSSSTVVTVIATPQTQQPPASSLVVGAGSVAQEGAQSASQVQVTQPSTTPVPATVSAGSNAVKVTSSQKQQQQDSSSTQAPLVSQVAPIVPQQQQPSGSSRNQSPNKVPAGAASTAAPAESNFQSQKTPQQQFKVTTVGERSGASVAVTSQQASSNSLSNAVMVKGNQGHSSKCSNDYRNTPLFQSLEDINQSASLPVATIQSQYLNSSNLLNEEVKKAANAMPSATILQQPQQQLQSTETIMVTSSAAATQPIVANPNPTPNQNIIITPSSTTAVTGVVASAVQPQPTAQQHSTQHITPQQRGDAAATNVSQNNKDSITGATATKIAVGNRQTTAATVQSQPQTVVASAGQPLQQTMQQQPQPTRKGGNGSDLNSANAASASVTNPSTNQQHQQPQQQQTQPQQPTPTRQKNTERRQSAAAQQKSQQVAASAVTHQQQAAAQVQQAQALAQVQAAQASAAGGGSNMRHQQQVSVQQQQQMSARHQQQLQQQQQKMQMEAGGNQQASASSQQQQSNMLEKFAPQSQQVGQPQQMVNPAAALQQQQQSSSTMSAQQQQHQQQQQAAIAGSSTNGNIHPQQIYQSLSQIQQKIEYYRQTYLSLDTRHKEAKEKQNMQLVAQIEKQKMQIAMKFRELQSHQHQYTQRLRMMNAAQPSVQQQPGSSTQAAAMQPYTHQPMQQSDKSKYRQNYQAVKYFHLQEQKTLYMQDQLRNSKYCVPADEDKQRSRAAYLAANQVKIQFQYDEQPQRRDVSIDYKMETKMINGQHYSELNRAALQKQQAQQSQQQKLDAANAASSSATANNSQKYPVSVTLPTKQWDNVRNFRPFLESATPDEKLNLLQKTLFKPKKRLKKLMEKRDQLVATKLAQSKKNAQMNSNNNVAIGQSNGTLVGAQGQQNGGFSDNQFVSTVVHSQQQDAAAGPTVAVPASSSSVDMIKCPVYKCAKKFITSIELDNHYQESHKDLIALGISLGQDQDTGLLKGCVKDTLLTSLITFAITNKDQFRIFQSDYQEDEANAVRSEIRELLKTDM